MSLPNSSSSLYAQDPFSILQVILHNFLMANNYQLNTLNRSDLRELLHAYRQQLQNDQFDNVSITSDDLFNLATNQLLPNLRQAFIEDLSYPNALYDLSLSDGVSDEVEWAEVEVQRTSQIGSYSKAKARVRRFGRRVSQRITSSVSSIKRFFTIKHSRRSPSGVVLDSAHVVCTICLERIDDEDDDHCHDKSIKLECNHLFHLKCLKQNVRYSRSCPVCRRTIANVASIVGPKSSVYRRLSDESSYFEE